VGEDVFKSGSSSRRSGGGSGPSERKFGMFSGHGFTRMNTDFLGLVRVQSPRLSVCPFFQWSQDLDITMTFCCAAGVEWIVDVKARK